MEQLYTAVGRLEKRMGEGGQYPVVIVSGKEYMMDIPEMILWTCCTWRISDLSRLQKAAEHMAREAGVAGIDGSRYVDRLLRRGLMVTGAGDNGAEALYDLLSSLYIVPVACSPLIRALAFLKFVCVNGMPLHKAKAVFRNETLSDRERRVLNLARQAQLSTAELIKCVETGVYDLSNDEKVMAALYDDDVTTCDNIGSYAKSFSQRLPVLETVANLYLRRLILFERI